MSLVQGYSSDEDDGPVAAANDAFGLASIPVAKKLRTDEPSSSKVTIEAAPHVLAEVRLSVTAGSLLRQRLTAVLYRIHYTRRRW